MQRDYFTFSATLEEFVLNGEREFIVFLYLYKVSVSCIHSMQIIVQSFDLLTISTLGIEVAAKLRVCADGCNTPVGCHMY